MFKKIIILSLLVFLPAIGLAQTDINTDQRSDRIFEARVVKILEEKIINRDDGSSAIQQNLLLRGLEKEWKNKEIEYRGISNLDIVSANIFKIGDKILVGEIKNIDGATDYYVLDFVRSDYLFWLAIIFAIVILVIGKMKGLKSLVSLVISFFIIIKFIIPQIILGANPLIVGVLGSLIILAIIIYLTEGWKAKSHIALASVFFSLIITFILSWIFTGLTRLTGLAQEDAVFLLGASNALIDFRGLLLSGILIGMVGVLDDVVVGQIESVRQIKNANPNLTNKEVYKSAYEVGNTHLGAIINTLFLTYAGASLPLLLLFYINPVGSITFTQAINNELIATEIVRTIVGSIGIALSIPISTYLATLWLKSKI